MSHLLKQILPLWLLVAIMLPGSLRAQSDPPDKPLPCGTDIKYLKSQRWKVPHTAMGITGGASFFSPSAIVSCGKVDLYYEDINNHSHRGFDDTTSTMDPATHFYAHGGNTYGEVRRNTLCGVLTYLQSVFDFSNVSDDRHLRIYIRQSIDSITNPAYPDGTLFLARAGFMWDSTSPGVKKGWFADYVTSPGWYHHDSVGLDYFHANVQVNFDKVITSTTFGRDTFRIAYYEDYLRNWAHDVWYAHMGQVDLCNRDDLFSVLLHEIGHSMGFVSFLAPQNTSATPVPVYYAGYPHQASALDWNLYVSENTYPLSPVKVISGTGDLPVFDASNPLFKANNNYWASNEPSPYAVAMYSGTRANPSFFSHIDDQLMSYSTRGRVSPGDAYIYVMAPAVALGEVKRELTKPELHLFTRFFGYRIRSDYAATHPDLVSNHLPFSKKMAMHNITRTNYAYYTETVAPDYTITNDSGVAITVQIDSLYDVDLVDEDTADAHHLIFNDATLVNFRGCGSGNNHELLAISADHKSITYTPRHNFYGRSNFGISISDGKENGSFRVFTIDVKKGNNVSAAVATNLVCNPDFTEGSETRLSASGYLGIDWEDTLHNSVVTGQGRHESKWQGISWSDGHPYQFMSNIREQRGIAGTIVRYSYNNCGNDLTRELTWRGDINMDYRIPDTMSDFTKARMQRFYNPKTGSYYLLLDTLKQCRRYVLEMDVRAAWDHSLSYVNLYAGFTDHAVNPLVADPDTTFNFRFSYNGAISASEWTHLTIPFYYCGSVSEMMYLTSDSTSKFFLDNLSLKEDTSYIPPLAVTIHKSPLPGCFTRLIATTTNNRCNVSFNWTTVAGTISAITDSNAIIVPTNIEAMYSVQANDQCHVAADSILIDRHVPPVGGTGTICSGDSLVLSDSLSGGAWVSTYAAIATVDSSGMVHGVSGGTVTILYVISCMDTVSTVVTVNPTPPHVTGQAYVCLGSSASLSDVLTGGIWESGNTGVATIDEGSGVVTGMATGTTVITYTLPTGCFTLDTLRVIVNPSPISGAGYVCSGSTITLTDTVTGGTWSSSSPSVATVNPVTGIVSGVTPGTVNITYSVSCGNSVVRLLTVDPAVPPISGTAALCSPATYPFYDSLPGGIWSAGNNAVLPHYYGNVFQAIAPGTAMVYYTVCGHTASFATTVNTAPAAINGHASVCTGLTTTLSGHVRTGTWVSSNAAVASVGALTDTSCVVTGITAGTAIITFSNYCGQATVTVTVNTNASAITGDPHVCAGAVTTLGNPVSGGTWSSSNPAIAAVSATGIVSGYTAGTAIISYTNASGCSATVVATVLATPSPIIGAGMVCMGSFIYLSDMYTGGTWSSSDPSIATISTTGIVTAVTPGTVTITYQQNAYCGAYKTVSVLAAPSITGLVPVCSGATLTLGTTAPGGTWSSTYPVIASVAASGVLTAGSAGTTAITYTSPAGCRSIAIATINPNPFIIYGDSSICAGAVGFLYDDMVGGSWSSSNPAQASVDITGMVWAATTPGTATISYTLPTGCYATYGVTVHETPAAIVIAATICSGASMTLSDATPGGTWSTSDAAIATIGSATGVVTGMASGAVYVTYTSPFGCLTASPLTIGSPGEITGAGSICVGATTTFSESVSGGTWSSSSPAVATISASGVLTTLSVGVTVISYQISTYCFATRSVTVSAMPSAITGSTIVCAGGTTTLGSATTGGTWSSVNPSVATIGSSSGVVTGVSSGVANIVYTSPSGCQALAFVTVSPVPAAISGSSSLCMGSSITLTDAVSGGTWSSSNTFVATVGSATGIVSSTLVTGTATITYRITPTCYVSKTVTVSAAPAPIVGPGTMCMSPSAATNLTDPTPGGAWSSSNPAVASVILGTVTGVSLGTATISYTLPTGCYATKSVTINASPGPITGVTGFCLGTTTTLAGSAPGGVWTSATPSYAAIGSSSGIVTGLIPGTVSISYTFPSTGCMSFIQVTVTTTPALSPIGGYDHLCSGATITLTETATGGGWYSSTPTVASIGTSGVVTGISFGTTVVSYVKANACGISTVTKTVSVNTLPEAIAGANSLCIDTPLHVTLTDATAGGTWSSSNTSVVVVGSTGILTAVSTGTATVSYSTGVGCLATTTIYIGKDQGDCTPCHELRKRPYTTWGAGGSITASLSGAYVYIPNTATVYGSVNLDNSVVFVAPGAAVNVDPAAVLAVNSSHLFSCANSMWNGITLLSDGSQTARLNLTGTYGGDRSTLIEDAIRAVLVKAPVRPNGGMPYYVNCNNVIFNRNNVGMLVSDYNPPTAGTISGGDPYAYEFHVENAVFTSRNLGIAGYPFAWPSTLGSGGLKYGITPPSPYQMPYNIINYPAALCHNSEWNICGIQLANVGGTTSPNYAGFIAGTPSAAVPFYSTNTQLTLYDNLAFGIYAVNANVTSKNSVYGNMHAVSPRYSKPVADNGFTGIYTAMNDADKYRLRVEPGTYTYTAGGRSGTIESPNYFYDCQFGVYSKDYYVISGKKSNMRTTQNTIGDNTRFGYYLQSSSYSDINVNQNSIYNVANGVFISSTLGAGYWIHTRFGPDMWVPGTQQAGNIRVNSNTIQATYDGGTPTTQYNAFAITLYNIVNSVGTSGTVLATGNVRADSNAIKDAYHGVTVQSYWAQQATSNLNTINIRLDPMNSTSYGISHTDCNKNVVYSNAVTGWGSVELKSDSVRAYYMVANQNAEIYCNYATNTCRGFEFFNNNAKNSWHDNRMVSNNKGLVINASAIGDQGINHYPSNNVWNTTGFDWTSRAQTYVYNGSNAANSNLVVPNSAYISVNPTYNFGVFPPYNYISGMSIIPTVPFATFPVCLSTGGGGGNTHHRQMMERIVKKQLNYQIDSAANDWFGQMATWQAMQYDSTLTDSSATLQSFHTLAASARFAHLSQLERSLAGGDLATVNAILTSATPEPLADSGTYTDTTTGVVVADDHNTDYVVDNYRVLFGLYQRYLQQSMSSDDSLQVEVIAGLCPTQYGSAVYRARCLYGTLTGILRTWNDDSCAADTTAHVAARHTRPTLVQNANEPLAQAYRLYPNPTASEFIIAQETPEKSVVVVIVSDMSGRTILTKNCIFIGGKVAIALPDVASGMYMVQLVDQSGKRCSFKLLKQ